MTTPKTKESDLRCYACRQPVKKEDLVKKEDADLRYTKCCDAVAVVAYTKKMSPRPLGKA